MKNLIGSIAIISFFLVISTGQSMWLKFKFRNYENNLTSFEAKDGEYHFCLTNSIGGEVIKVSVIDKYGEFINDRSKELYKDVLCYKIPIPKVNNILTYGRKKWDFLHSMTTEDISKVKWHITRKKKRDNLSDGVLEIKN